MFTDGRKKVLYKAMAFTFGILFFALLFAILLINWQKTDLDKGMIEVSNKVQEMKLFNALSDTLLFDSNSCKLMENQMKGFAGEVYKLGKLVLAYYETNQGSQESIDLQKQHVYLNLELWLKLEKYNKICENKRNYILYFYPYNCSECAPLAGEINELREVYGDALWVFSIPGQINSKTVDILQHYYGVDYLPSVVVNGTTLKGSESFKEIEKYLVKE